MGYFSRLDKAADLVSGMAERLGKQLMDVDSAAGETAVRKYRNMVVRCASCENQDECGSLQASNGRLSKAPDYCRNKAEMNRVSA